MDSEKERKRASCKTANGEEMTEGVQREEAAGRGVGGFAAGLKKVRSGANPSSPGKVLPGPPLAHKAQPKGNAHGILLRCHIHIPQQSQSGQPQGSILS